MLGLIEDLALEEIAAGEHEQRAGELWRARQYVPAIAERKLAAAARERARELRTWSVSDTGAGEAPGKGKP